MFSKRKSIFLGLLADTPGMAMGGAAKAGFTQSRVSAGAVMNSWFWLRRQAWLLEDSLCCLYHKLP